MATREENLKKINEKLEAMTDEQLDKVTGGAINELYRDSYFLNKFGLCDRYDYWDIVFSSGRPKIDKIGEAWEKAGVRCDKSEFISCHYFIDGKQVSRKEAFDYVAKKYGATYNWNDYKW